MPDLCFDHQRHCVLRIQETEKHTIYICIDKLKGKRAVVVSQLPLTKFNNTYKHEVTATSVKETVEKWMGLSSLGVIITPAARHAFAEILTQEATPMAQSKATPNPPKKVAPAKTSPAKPEPKKGGKAAPTVKLTSKPKGEKPLNPNEPLPFDTAEVRAAPAGTGLKPGKTLKGEDPEPHTSHPQPNTQEPTVATKTNKKTAKPEPKKPEPKKAAKPEPKKPEPKKAGKPEPKKSEETKVKGGDLAGKKIKVNSKADMSLVREGTVRMALMKAVMASPTVDEALKKTVKRTDGEKMAVNLTHIKMAIDYGFITV